MHTECITELEYRVKLTEEKLPPAILDKAIRGGNEFHWRVNDIPFVIEAARASGLASIGGSLTFIGLPGTASADVGTCECYWVEVSISSLLGEEWGKTVDDSARQAKEQFVALLKKYDFHREGAEFPTVADYRKKGGDLNDIMYFSWMVNDEEDHRKFEDDLKSGRTRTLRPTPPEWGCKPPTPPIKSQT